jgi:hypothetical protein
VKKLLKVVLSLLEAARGSEATLRAMLAQVTQFHTVVLEAAAKEIDPDLIAIEITYAESAEGAYNVPAVRMSGLPGTRPSAYHHKPIRYSEVRVVRLQQGIGMVKWHAQIAGHATFEVVRGRAVLSLVQVARNVVAFMEAPVVPGHEIAVTVETLERLAPPKGLGQ